MAASNYSSAAASAAAAPLSYPCPRSPPKYPDMTGKHRELVKVQKLEREIGFLEEELKSVENLQPASKSCKEVDNYVGANPDPLIPINRKIRRSCRFWKWLCGKSCLNLSWICCCSCGCSLHLETSNCCALCPSKSKNRRCSGCCSCCSRPCSRPSCCCNCSCLEKASCSKCCCIVPAKSCSDCCSCIRCTSCSCFKCSKPCRCPNCTNFCCNPCRLFC